MYRVELKVDMPNSFTRKYQMFLMYRVELKALS